VAQQSRAPCGYRTYQLLRGTQTYRAGCQGANRHGTSRILMVLSRSFMLLDLRPSPLL
jgi:hypothetical protein